MNRFSPIEIAGFAIITATWTVLVSQLFVTPQLQPDIIPQDMGGVVFGGFLLGFAGWFSALMRQKNAT